MISKAQAVAEGLTLRQVEWRLATGRWQPLYLGVYLAAEHEHTVDSWLRYTWHDLTQRPAAVVAEIRAVPAARATAAPRSPSSD